MGEINNNSSNNNKAVGADNSRNKSEDRRVETGRGLQVDPQGGSLCQNLLNASHLTAIKMHYPRATTVKDIFRCCVLRVDMETSNNWNGSAPSSGGNINSNSNRILSHRNSDPK